MAGEDLGHGFRDSELRSSTLLNDDVKFTSASNEYMSPLSGLAEHIAHISSAIDNHTTIDGVAFLGEYQDNEQQQYTLMAEVDITLIFIIPALALSHKSPFGVSSMSMMLTKCAARLKM